MSDLAASLRTTAARARTEAAPARWALIAATVGFLSLFLLAPLVAVAIEASRKGWQAYLDALAEHDALAAILLTLTVAALVVPLHAVFGLCAAWCVAKFQFRGKSALVTLIDLPFSVSPVVSGLVFVLLFGAQSALGAWLMAHGLRIIFAVPGIVLATLFVTFPFVAREVIPLMQQLGKAEEEVALTLGAGGLKVFLTVTLPNVKWALLAGILLTNARAMGEFGAVSVVSGHIRGLTDTMPLQIEVLYNEYQFVPAFAVASLLAFLALATLVAKSIVEWRAGKAKGAVE